MDGLSLLRLCYSGCWLKTFLLSGGFESGVSKRNIISCRQGVTSLVPVSSRSGVEGCPETGFRSPRFWVSLGGVIMAQAAADPSLPSPPETGNSSEAFENPCGCGLIKVDKVIPPP